MIFCEISIYISIEPAHY